MQHPVREQEHLVFFLIHSYAASYSVYRKWVCGAATAKALSSQGVTLIKLYCWHSQSTNVQNFPKCRRRKELRRGLGNSHCVFIYCKCVYVCCSVYEREMEQLKVHSVTSPPTPPLWIQQEMPEAETVLWLFDSSNRWFPVEQVSLLIFPLPHCLLGNGLFPKGVMFKGIYSIWRQTRAGHTFPVFYILNVTQELWIVVLSTSEYWIMAESELTECVTFCLYVHVLQFTLL